MSVPASSGGRALPLLALTALALPPLGQVSIPFGFVGAALVMLVAVIAARELVGGGRRHDGAAAGDLRSDGSAVRVVACGGVLWLSSRWWPQLRPAPGWFPAGRSAAGSWVLAAVTVIGAAAALTAWILSEPELGDSTLQLVDLARDTPTALIVAFVVVFVAVNPLVEEVAYRNVAYQAAHVGAPAAGAVLLQAVSFGTLHVVGFPAGVTGVGLSFFYGVMLGIIRVMTGGLRVAVIAHVATNATIVALVVLFLLPE